MASNPTTNSELPPFAPLESSNSFSDTIDAITASGYNSGSDLTLLPSRETDMSDFWQWPNQDFNPVPPPTQDHDQNPPAYTSPVGPYLGNESNDSCPRNGGVQQDNGGISDSDWEALLDWGNEHNTGSSSAEDDQLNDGSIPSFDRNTVQDSSDFNQNGLAFPFTFRPDSGEKHKTGSPGTRGIPLNNGGIPSLDRNAVLPCTEEYNQNPLAFEPTFGVDSGDKYDTGFPRDRGCHYLDKIMNGIEIWLTAAPPRSGTIPNMSQDQLSLLAISTLPIGNLNSSPICCRRFDQP